MKIGNVDVGVGCGVYTLQEYLVIVWIMESDLTAVSAFLQGALMSHLIWQDKRKYYINIDHLYGYYTYNVPANEDCGFICPVCFWENDPFIASDSVPSDSNNGMTLKKGKKQLFGIWGL